VGGVGPTPERLVFVVSDFKFSRFAFAPAPADGFQSDLCNVAWITDYALSDEEFAAFFDNPLGYDEELTTLLEEYTGYAPDRSGEPTVLVAVIHSPSSPVVVLGAMIDGVPMFALAPAVVLQEFKYLPVSTDSGKGRK